MRRLQFAAIMSVSICRLVRVVVVNEVCDVRVV